MFVKLEEVLAFVKSQIEFHEKRAEKYSSSKFRQHKHLETSENFSQLSLFIEQLSEKAENLSASAQNGFTGGIKGTVKRPAQLLLNLLPGDLEGLPDELIEELSVTGSDKAEFEILSVLEKRKGIASLDQLLIELYHSTGEIHKRQTLTSRLYRMTQKGLVFNVPNKKGVYSLEDLTEPAVAELLAEHHDTEPDLEDLL